MTSRDRRSLSVVGQGARRSWTTAVLIAALAILASACSNVASPSQLSIAAPPNPKLANYIPATAEVTGETTAQLAPSGPPQRVVTYISEQQSSSGFTYRDFVILSWDPYAKRWVSVFDGSKVQAPLSVGQSSQDGAVLPVNANVPRLEVIPIIPKKGRTDLVFWSFVNAGANGNLEVGIVHYDGQTASLGYFQTYSPGQGTPTVTGVAPNQQLSIPAGWITTDDPQCCAIRTYVTTVGLRTQTFPNGPPNTSYVVTASTQSWLGVFAAVPPNQSNGSTQPNPVVISVVPGSPAAGVLQSGDQLVSVSGDSVPSSSDLGPPVIDEVAKSLPGATIPLVILRNGAQQVVNIKLASTASSAYTSASAPDPGYLGVEITTSTGSSGAEIAQVDSGSPAQSAGLVEGDVITSIGSTPVTSQQDLQTALYLLQPGTSVQIAYLDPNGNAQTATATVGGYPSDSTGPSVVNI